MTIEHTPIINTADLIADEEAYERTLSKEEHLHPRGQSGTSNIPQCDHRVALKTVGFALPEIPDGKVKKKKGAIQEGSDIHEVKQDRMVRRCQRLALDHGYMYHPEVYQPLSVYNDAGKLIITLVSPMDNYYGLPNADGKIIEMRWLDFKNMPIEKPVIAKGSIPVQVDDIKTMGTWAFKRLLEGKVSFNYECQFHSYMAMIDKEIIWIYAQQKETGEVTYHAYEWNQAVWDELVMILERKKDLIDLYDQLKAKQPTLKYHNLIPPHPKNLGCLQLEHDNIDWWSCELSEVEEYYNKRSAKQTQRLKLPCKAAQHYMKKLYTERFPIGSLWVRRNEDPLKWGSYVVIEDNDLSVDMQRWTISRAMGSKGKWSWGKKDIRFYDDPITAWVGLKPVTIRCIHEICPRGYPKCAYTSELLRNCPEHQIEIVK